LNLERVVSPSFGGMTFFSFFLAGLVGVEFFWSFGCWLFHFFSAKLAFTPTPISACFWVFFHAFFCFVA